MIVDAAADFEQTRLAVMHSLDRKVCNTLNVCCILRSGADTLVAAVVAGARAAAAKRGTRAVLHATESATPWVNDVAFPISAADLGTEWEWETQPELSIVVVDSVAEAVELFNTHSPRLAASMIGADEATWREFYDTVDAPFVGNGFTRWVDGQFAFDQPELGLSNWQSGRTLGRGAVLSGDSVFTVRTEAKVRDHELHR